MGEPRVPPSNPSETIVLSESNIVSEGFKGGTRGAPIMPRDASLPDSKYVFFQSGHLKNDQA